MLRNAFFAVMVGLAVSGAAWAQAPRPPYLATVQKKQAFVRSGPGQQYYPTGVLKQGAVVEVYRHDPGGWLAIRPPAGSFCWVPAETVQLVDVDVGEIIRGDVPARIGSTLNGLRDLWQVKLRKGEKVAIIQRVDDATGSWYQIEPPAGEFRWIYHQAVVPLAGKSGPRSASPAASPEATAEGSPGNFADGSPGDFSPGFPAGSSAGGASEVKQAAHTAPGASGQPPRELPLSGRGEAAVPRPGGLAEQQAPAAGARAGTLVPVAQDGEEAGKSGSAEPRVLPPADSGNQPASSRQIEAELDWLDLELSRTVCRPREHWQLEPLRRQAEQLVAAARHPTVRARARELLRRIERFELIRTAQLGTLSRRRRLQQLATAGGRISLPQADSLPEPFTGDANPAEKRPPARSGWVAATTQRRYDAQGQLVPVRSRGFAGPHYAVVDPVTGKVRAYLSGAPGVNLGRFVGRNVGVIGIQEVVPRLDAKHVAARRVELLDRPVKR